MDGLKKTRKVIEKEQQIDLLPDPGFGRDSFPAALGLFYALRKLGKNVNLLTNGHPKVFDFLVQERELGTLQNADFRISIREAGTKLSDLFYEKTAQGINLFLKTSGGELKKEDISFEKLAESEVLITVGVDSFKKTQRFLKKEPGYIINIDNNPNNENFGHANLVEPQSATVSEIILQTISFLSENLFDKEISTPLLAGIIYATSYFQNSKLSPQTFQKIGFLVEQGADLKTISEELCGETQESTVHLFGEILSKTHFSEDQGLGWVLLKEGDFVKTNSTPKDLKFTLEKMSSDLFPFQNFLILWESHNSPSLVKGVFYSPNKALLEKIASKFLGQIKGKGVLFGTNETTLQAAKDKVLSILNL